MESLAPPGTEDHIASPGSSTFVSKKNSETDRLLSLRYVLPNGSTANVFELTWQNGSEIWYCHVCVCPVMGQVFNHEQGKRHVAAMEATMRNQRNSPGIFHKPTSGVDNADWDNVPTSKKFLEPKVEMKVAPGEPVPPGFEGEITKVAQIQERLDDFKQRSIIGLEYLLELQDYDQDREPSYFCLLCGKKGDLRTIIPHLVSYNHLQYYLQRHYTKTYIALAPFSTHKKYKKCWQENLTKIADAIEAKYGRMLPHPMDKATYESNKQEVYNKVSNGPHFSENNGISFEYLVNRDEIIRISDQAFMEELNNDKKQRSFGRGREPVRDNSAKQTRNQRSLSSVSSISSDEFDYSTHDRDRDRGRDRVPSRPAKLPPSSSSLYNRRRRTRSRSRSRSRSPYRRRGEDSLPWNRPEYRRNEYNSSKDRRSKEDDREGKKDEFRRLAAAIEKDMESQLRRHQLNPEKHPQYNEEWKIFWNKRYKELQAEGKDTQGYDFKPEWIVYWNKKMEEFHKAAVKHQIDSLRRRLGLAEVAPISFKISTSASSSGGLGRRNFKSACQPVAAQPDQDHEVIVIDDSRDDKGRSRDGSHSPWESDTNSPRKDFRRRPVGRRSTRTRSPSKSRSRSLSPYRRRSYGRHRSRSRSHSKGRSKGNRYRRSTRSRSKSPQIRRDVDNKSSSGRHSAEWDRGMSYKTQQKKETPFAPSGKDTILVRESTLKKQVILDEQITNVEDLGAEVNIVAVLRLLTALEDKLGSLGPKVVDLLATALSMEKKTPNSSEQLFDDETNCVMFETIKEKLKGLLHAGLVAEYSTQGKAIKTSVSKIACLLHLASKRKLEKEAKKASKLNIDRVAIALQIADALMRHGKTDVPEGELEQLVDRFVQMLEASIDSGKPITTANFLEMTKQCKPEAKSEPAVNPQDDSKTSGKSTDADVEKDASHAAKDAMDGLSDLELQTLLQSFKDLSAEEQSGLIAYLKKLEAKEPARVETLRKFVNLEPSGSSTTIASRPEEGRISPFSKKLSENMGKTTAVSSAAATKESKLGISDDEEDYSYEDVFKAASKNLSDKQQPDMSNLINNIMVSIASNANLKTNAPTTSTVKMPLGNNPVLQQPQQAPPSQQIQGFNYNGNKNSAGNLNMGNMGNAGPLGNFPQRPQQPYRQFPNGPQGPGQNMRPPMQQMQGNVPHMQNMQHNYPDNMQQRFYPSNLNNANPNPNQNYNYYNRW